MAATPGDDLATPSTLSSESTTEPAEQAVAPVTGMTKPAQTIENDAELTPVAPPVPEAPPIAPPVKNPATSKTDVALITPRLTVPEAHADINPALEQLATIGIHDGNWLLKQDKTHWTLQILGARDPQTLLKFAHANNLGDDTAWYKTQLTNKPWYILVHRIYTDQNIARQSIARLPANLQKSRPWVKSLDAVHKAIQP
jgi:DamX protein